MDNEEQHIVGIRWDLLNQRLVSIALIVFIVSMIGMFMIATGVETELHLLQVDIVAQGNAIQATMDTNGLRLDTRLRDLHQTASTLRSRVDEQMTDTRAQIKQASQDTAVQATKQLKETTAVLKDQLETTTDAVVGAVEKSDNTPAIPPKITITPAPPLVIPVTPPIMAPPAPAPPAEAAPQKRVGPAKRLWHHLWK